MADHHQQARRGDLLWSQEWGVGFRHANQPSTLLSFLGLQLDMTGSSAATSGSCSTLQRVDWAGDAFEAHNPYLRARDHVAVRQSPVSCQLHRQGWSVLERRIECVARLAFISPAATRLVSDGRPGALAHGAVALHGAAQRARFGLCGPARSNCWRNTGVSCALEPVGNQRSS